jgi:ribonuclease/clavin/mitogillin
LIDTGEGKPEWIKTLRTVLDEEKIAIDKIILTHWHHDHVSGVPDLVDVVPNMKVYKNQPMGDWLNISDGQIFKVEGATLKAFHCPGHTTDHMALILEEEDAMFTGDNILGQGTAVFEDYGTYMKSLDSMSVQFSGRAYPGHGPVIEDGPAKALEYISHRKEREKQVLEVLSQEREGGWTAMDTVRIIYKSYPENLHAPAERGIFQILKKLAKDGKVAHDEARGSWALSTKPAL